MEQQHRESIAELHETYEKKIQISKQKREFKNEKLFEAENTETQL